MKSIREWMKEKGMVREDLDPSLTVRMTGSQLETENDIRAILKQAYEKIKRLDKYKEMPKEQLLDEMQDALMLLVAEIKGNRSSTMGAVRKINQSDDPIARETV